MRENGRGEGMGRRNSSCRKRRIKVEAREGKAMKKLNRNRRMMSNGINKNQLICYNLQY
jgi:hypothetical protein